MTMYEALMSYKGSLTHKLTVENVHHNEWCAILVDDEDKAVSWVTFYTEDLGEIQVLATALSFIAEELDTDSLA